MSHGNAPYLDKKARKELKNAPHVHRCMRCGQAFFCLSPKTCKAKVSVMPRVVVPGPDDTAVMFEHVCVAKDRTDFHRADKGKVSG